MERKWWTLLAVCIGTFMLLLDVTIVNTALPYIERSLGASFSDLQWVIDAYALSLAALLLTGGSLADLFGRRLVFVIGLVVFTAASLACGLAGTPLALNLSRAVQGIGGALMFATALALLADAFRGADRGTAFGLWGATTGAAVAVGPLVGGALTEGLGWEYIFFVNIPIGIGAVALTLARSTSRATRREAASTGPASSRSPAGLFCLVFALIRGNAEGWGSSLIVGLLVAGALLLLAFWVAESRQRTPMLDLSLFRKPAFNGASIAAFSLSAAMFAMFLYLTLYVQNALGYSALEAGLRFLPVTLLSFLVAPLSGKLAERYGVRWFIAGGLALVGVGLLLMRRIEPGDDWTAMLAGLHGRRRRDRRRQPGAGHRRDRRRRAAPLGHGLGDQLDVPPGRHRHRHRGARRGLHARGERPGDRVRGRARARGRGDRRRHARRPVLRLHLVRRLPADRRRRRPSRSPASPRSSRGCTASCSTAASRRSSRRCCARC